MAAKSKIRVALAGLAFGAEFAPIYLHHPDVEYLAICDSNKGKLAAIGDRFGVERRYTDLAKIIDSNEFDAVHLVTPIPLHASQSVAVLESGKHCACTVPAAISIDDLHALVAAQRASGRNYMMMETSVYTREFLFVKQMMAAGELGKLTFLRGAHYQDMENWPPYWKGLPPMFYATHAIAPILSLANTRASVVHCFGSGELRPDYQKQYANPFPAETAIFRLKDTDLAAEVTRTLFETARAYTESFSVYGNRCGFEWQQIESEPPVLFKYETADSGRGGKISHSRIDCPDRQDLLPASIARFTQRGVYDESNPSLSFLQGGGHGGSHPHMVHEFVSSIIEHRSPSIDAVTAANWTAAGICAHESAMNGGTLVEVPSFD